MELSNIEIIRFEKTVEKSSEQQFQELNELQLATVGGGCGEVVFY